MKKEVGAYFVRSDREHCGMSAHVSGQSGILHDEDRGDPVHQ